MFVDFLFYLEKYTQLPTSYLALSQVFLLLMAIASLRALVAYFIFKERNLIIENETKLANLRELKAKAELKSLQSQINPHFLYNSLNSIASLAPVDAQKTQKWHIPYRICLNIPSTEKIKNEYCS
jgi:sensor histidine kinase YesM